VDLVVRHQAAHGGRGGVPMWESIGDDVAVIFR
jgi:hypothetical protein